MNWLEQIQQKPQKHKIRLVWLALIVCFVALCVVWVFTSQIGKKRSGDLGLFSAFNQGVKNFQQAWLERSSRK